MIYYAPHSCHQKFNQVETPGPVIEELEDDVAAELTTALAPCTRDDMIAKALLPLKFFRAIGIM